MYRFGVCDIAEMWPCHLCSLVDWQPFLSFGLYSDMALSSLQFCRLATILVLAALATLQICGIALAEILSTLATVADD